MNNQDDKYDYEDYEGCEEEPFEQWCVEAGYYCSKYPCGDCPYRT